MFVNLSSTTFMIAATGLGMMYSSSAYAQSTTSDTPLLDNLVGKHDLANSERNHQTDTLPTKIQDQVDAYAPYVESVPLQNKINNIIATPSPLKYTVDDIKAKYPDNYGTSAPTFNDYKDLSVNLSKTHGQPSGTVVGNKLDSMDVEYAKSGTRQFVRDPVTGKLQLQVITGVDKVSGLPKGQLFSEEVNGTQYSFETDKEDMYGDSDAIYQQGRDSYDNFKDPTVGKNGAGRSFRAITAGATNANSTAFSETDLWLQPSFAQLNDAQVGSNWLSACSDTTTTQTSTYTYGQATEYQCQDTSQSSFDYCEVERKIIIPAYSSSPGLRSCGAGCYEFDLTITAPKSSSCRTTYGTTASYSAATFDMVVNLKPGVVIQNVNLNLNADDHVKISLNGGTLWESLGNINSGSCENGGNPTLNAPVTSQVNSIVAGATGQVPLSFRGDIRWKSKGWLNATIKIQLNDTTGDGFDSEFIQYPAGCYDALSAEDKLTKGLNGVYNWSEIGIDNSTPPVYFQCESPAQMPTCGSGELLFGNPGQEMCYTPSTQQATCPVGLLNSTQDLCTYAATSATCPSGGTLNGSICELPVTIVNTCGGDTSKTLTDLMMYGVNETMCSTAPSGVTTNIWNCSPSSNTYSPSICSISRESFLDEYGNIVEKYDSSGNLLPSPVDSEGQPIIFTDIANCVISGSTPVVEDVVPPASFCTFDSYQSIDEDSGGYPQSVLDLIPPFYDGDVGNTTWRVNLNGYRCDPTGGNIMCLPDPITGEEVCTSWEEIRTRPNLCLQYSADPNCTEVSRDCTEGWEEAITGRCMAESVTYSCVEETAVDYESTSTSNVCDAMLPCTGGECDIGAGESNDKFVQAMVAGSVLDNIQGDSNCTDPSDPSTCTIFNGEYEYCSWEVSGLGTDCCEAPQGVDILAYVSMARQLLKINQMAGAGAFGDNVANGYDAVSGAYENLSEPITDAYNAVAEWASTGVRSATESIFGNTEAVSGSVSAVSEGITAALSSVQQSAYRLVYDIMPDTLGDFLFSAAGDVAADQGGELVLNDAITNAFSNVMAIYTAYQMVKLALTLLTACDDNEIDMGVKIAQRQCFKVGNRYCSKDALGVCYQRRQEYCCYSSILSRIIMKESYIQLGIDPLPFGNKPDMFNGESEASCPGLTSEQLAMVDFDTPSMQSALQEWVGLLLDSGEMVTDTSEQFLTGGATIEQRTDCPLQQKPILTCYIDQLSGDEICNQQRDSLGNVMYESVPTDCGGKLTGGGQIWNAADRVTASERIAGANGYIGTAQDRVQESKDAMRTLPGNIDCSIVPKPPVCLFGFDPVQP